MTSNTMGSFEVTCGRGMGTSPEGAAFHKVRELPFAVLSPPPEKHIIRLQPPSETSVIRSSEEEGTLIAWWVQLGTM